MREKDWGFLVFGHQVSEDGTGQTRCMAYRLDPQGVLIDRSEWDSGSAYDFNFGYVDPVAEGEDGAYASAVSRFNGPQRVLWLYSFDTDGTLTGVDTLVFDDPADSITVAPRATRPTPDGGFIVTGFRSIGSAYSKAFLLKVDSAKQFDWLSVYGADDVLTESNGVAGYVGGGYVLTGIRLGGSTTDRSFLIRTDSVGNQMWRKNFGNAVYGMQSVRTDTDGFIYVWSEYREQNWATDRDQVMLRKFDGAGSLIWEKRTHYFLDTRARDFEILPDHSFITCGGRSTFSFIAKYSAEGDSLWSRDLHIFSLYALADLFDVQPASDGGFLLTGYVVQDFIDPTPNLQTLWVIKTDSLGCVVPGCQNVGVQEYVMDLQKLLRVSPNPASDWVQVALDLPEGGEVEGHVQAQLLDATGKLVVEHTVQQNLNQLRTTLDVSALPAGTYYLHVRDAKRWLAGCKLVVV